MRNPDSYLPLKVFPGAHSTKTVQDVAILKIAHATVELSRFAPQLSEMASARQTDAEHQAENVHEITNSVRTMNSVLTETVKELSDSAREINKLADLIQRIANETRMIAINSGIAAAHAGEHGKVFSLLAGEIRKLSEDTAAATKDVSAKINRLQKSTMRTAQVVGIQEESRSHDDENDFENIHGLYWLLEKMNEADESTTLQVDEARQLNSLGMHLRKLSEDMIHSVGTFRLEVHERVEQLLEELRTDEELLSGDPRWQITALRQVIRCHPYIELAYVTNEEGIQMTKNVFRNNISASYGDSGKNKDWSERPWFRGAMNTSGVYLSDIYRSQATDEFCLTASSTLVADDIVIGVVALDINFREILDQ